MRKQAQKVFQIAILLFVMQIMLPTLMAQPIPSGNGPIGSIINIDTNNQIKYWDGTVWISVTPGQPGQSLRFVNGVPTWINNQQATVADFDGNVYETVKIGTQTWMKQDLKTTHYLNGDAIPDITDNSSWGTLTTGAYCNYNNDVSNTTTYGRIYNYYTVADSRNLCPAGWHVSTNADWTTLANYLGGADIAGGKLKEAGTTHWASINVGATNETGFTALPGGYRELDGTFHEIGENDYWWTTNVNSSTEAWFWNIAYHHNNAYNFYGSKNYGISVRCMKD